MGRIIRFSIVTATPLVILITLFLFWAHSPTIDMSATAINTPALAMTKTAESADATQPATTTDVTVPAQATTDVVAPAQITAAQPVEIIVIPTLPIETTAVIKEVPRQTPPKPAHMADLLHSRTNITRAKNNRTELSFDTSLSALAKERSEEMIRDNYFSHTSPDGCNLQCRLSNSGYETLSWGENLAESTSYQMLSNAELADMFMQSWLKSSNHRDNVLSKKFTRQGIGVAHKDGRIVVTVIFAAP